MNTGELAPEPAPPPVSAAIRHRSLTVAARELVQTDELPLRARTVLRQFLSDFDRWREKAREITHIELAETVLDESGYHRHAPRR